MLHVRDATQLGVGIGEKVVGLSVEIAGAILGSTQLVDRGRQLDVVGAKRLHAVEDGMRSSARPSRPHRTTARKTTARKTTKPPKRATGAQVRRPSKAAKRPSKRRSTSRASGRR